ncbi:ankyrin repeat-containing domain protein [Plectosphaerella plurivora]|uniref:Ankyrin repeat-containing domain protein n=1 Tax=Plectosphaerella plurivora TaxID=936078 RepID=A0A9P8V8Y6_9PEZI|nr:ankyrin repeat-containing domain protein [Plectosphaerella plurivora]
MARQDIDMNQTDNGRPDGRTSLHIAATLGNADVMRQLFTHKDVNIESRASRAGSMTWTALVYAASYGNKECLEVLLDNGADINYLDCYSGNALMRAADGDYPHVAKLLVDRGINVKHKDFLGRTALHSAATNQSWATLEYFLHDVPRIDINMQDDAGGTDLHDACYYLDTRSVRLLISAGARCDLVDQKGDTPVDMATLRKGLTTLEALKKSPSFRGKIETQSDVKKSLVEAVKSDPVEVLQVRLEAVTVDDPELNTPLPFDGTPLHQACKRGEAEIVKLLLSAGADMEIRNTSDWTPLFTAMRCGRQNCAKVLIAHGAHVESSVFSDVTLWQYAWSQEMPDIALLLIEHGAVVEKGSRYIQEILQKAADDGNVVVARQLVEAGASVHHKIDGETALQTAEISGACAVLEYFASLDK